MALALAALVALGAVPAGAVEPSDASDVADTSKPRPEPRVPSPLPELAAVVPGLLVHGSGTWLQRRTQTSERLLLMEGTGLLTAVASALLLFETGAARNVVGPLALTSVAGVGTMGLSLLASLYATWAPPAGFGAPRLRLPLLESRLGYLYVTDPQFDFNHFLTTRLDARLGAWHAGFGAAYAPAQDNQRIELVGGYRLLGARAPEWGEPAVELAADGSYLELQFGFDEHHFDGSGFLVRELEAKLEGRLDTDRYLPDVHGAFFQLEVGLAKQWFVFDLPGVSATTGTSLLLAHMGFGMYLGNQGPPGVESTGGDVEFYYDHRHDGFAGGMKARGLGSGVLGHVGLVGNYQLTPRWGLRAQTEVGSAWTFGLSGVIRVGTL